MEGERERKCITTHERTNKRQKVETLERGDESEQRVEADGEKRGTAATLTGAS